MTIRFFADGKWHHRTVTRSNIVKVAHSVYSLHPSHSVAQVKASLDNFVERNGIGHEGVLTMVCGCTEVDDAIVAEGENKTLQAGRRRLLAAPQGVDRAGARPTGRRPATDAPCGRLRVRPHKPSGTKLRRNQQ